MPKWFTNHEKMIHHILYASLCFSISISITPTESLILDGDLYLISMSYLTEGYALIYLFSGCSQCKRDILISYSAAWLNSMNITNYMVCHICHIVVGIKSNDGD